MPMSCTCKQCGREAPPAAVCAYCGAKLNPNQAHAMWRMERRPVADWMCWNAIMRVVLPVLAAVLLLVMWVECLSDGLAGIERLIRGGLLQTMGLLLAGILLAVLLVLALQGKELLVCSVDGKGLMVERYLPAPNVLKLLLRLKSPALLQQIPHQNQHPILPLDAQTITWKEIARVQLWPEKGLLLFYAPRWWQRLALPCTRESWQETCTMIRQKIGKKKQVILPPSLR